MYLNGSIICRNYCGYNPFEADITDYVCEGRNVLAVYVDTTTSHEGWWYEGGGIYRHVWLVKTEKVCVDTWGVYVHPEKQNENLWRFPAKTTIVNDAEGTLKVYLRSDNLKTSVLDIEMSIE